MYYTELNHITLISGDILYTLNLCILYNSPLLCNNSRDNMRLIIMENADKVSEWAAKYVVKRIKEFNPGPDRYFVLGLPTGITILTFNYYYIANSLKNIVIPSTNKKKKNVYTYRWNTM